MSGVSAAGGYRSAGRAVCDALEDCAGGFRVAAGAVRTVESDVLLDAFGLGALHRDASPPLGVGQVQGVKAVAVAVVQDAALIK